MRYYVLVLLVLFFAVASGLAVRPHIWEIVDGIVAENELHSSRIGRGGITGKQWKRYVALRTEATAEELVDLTDYTNPVVRSYAFMALVERNHPDVFTILVQHSNDRDTMLVLSGCTGRFAEVREFLAGTVTHGGFIDNAKRAYRLSATQKATVDSLLALPASNK